MKKSADAFRTISEVAEWLDTPAHVLRFWESRFAQVKPVKRAGGRRYYRPNDMLLLGGIKKLLHEDGMTIRGVQKLLRDEGVKHVSAFSAPLSVDDEGEIIEGLQAEISSDDTMEAGLYLDAEPAPLENVHQLTAAEADAAVVMDEEAAMQSDAEADMDDLQRLDGVEEEPDPEALFQQTLELGEKDQAVESDDAPSPEPAPQPILFDVPEDPDDSPLAAEGPLPGITEVARGLRNAHRRTAGLHKPKPDPLAIQEIMGRLTSLRERMAETD